NGSTPDPVTEQGEGMMSLIKAMKSARIRFEVAIADFRDGMGWIWFAHEKDVLAFLDLAVEYDPHPRSNYRRLLKPWDGSGVRPAWSLEMQVEDVSGTAEIYEDDDEPMSYRVWPAKFQLSYVLKIPPCDWPGVLRRLQSHKRNRRAKKTHSAPSSIS